MTATKPESWYEQSGVVPYRIREGRLEVLLITSARKSNWIVPKGIIEEGLSPEDSALKEALEEAGVEGHVVGKPLGEYKQDKWGGTCRIQIFAMQVGKQHKSWPEAKVRERQWFPLDEAVDAVSNNDLASIIARLAWIIHRQK